MDGELRFRKADINDLDAIAAIYDHAHDAEEAGLVTTGWVRGIYPVRETAEASLDRGDMYVAELDGKVVATGIINQIQVNVYLDCDWDFKAPEDDVSVLHTLVVDPGVRGKGIGPAFVRFWENYALEHDCYTLRIDTNARNTLARKMYEKMGYRETDVIPTVFNGIQGVDLVLIEKYIGTEIQKKLREMRDEKYADFQAKLTPGIDRDRFIGVRTPQLRAFAKDLVRGRAEDVSPETAERFLAQLPHKYFDENQLHAFMISEIKDFDRCMDMTEVFLPYVNNWATCDQLSPKVFAKHKAELLDHIYRWIDSCETYTIRFGIGMLMEHFLDGDFDESYLDRVAQIRSDEYYVNMMIAWYFATALAKQYVPALAVIEEGRLDVWSHNKAIQKAIESRRITPEQKEYLRSLKRKK